MTLLTDIPYNKEGKEKKLPKSLRNYRTKFELTDEQVKKLEKWDTENPTDSDGTLGANIIFQFTPTSIGLAVQVKKMSDGQMIELDLTEYDNW